MPETTTAHLEDGRHVEVPASAARQWRSDVHSGITTDGLASWYTEGDPHAPEIQGDADDDPRCDHDEHSHRIVNESQIGPDAEEGRPLRMARVCHRRACILEAMAWVERGTGEPAAWAAPYQDYQFDVPKEIPAPKPAHPAAPVSPRRSRLGAIMADHDRGPEHALVQCTGADFTCDQQARVEESRDLSDAEIAARLKERGWSVSPTLCPRHNLTQGQVPLSVPEIPFIR